MAVGCERLLSELNERLLAGSSTVKSTGHRLQQAKAQLKKAKLSFMKQHLLYQMLQFLSITYDGVAMRLSLAEATQCLGLSTSDSMFGIQPHQMCPPEWNTPEWREEKKKVINSMREEFQKHVEVVGDKDNRAAIKKRSDSIEELQEEDEELKKKVDARTKKLFTLLGDNYQLLTEQLSEAQFTADFNEVSADYMLSKSKAMLLKLRMLKLKVLVATYSGNKSAALKEIKAQLVTMKAQLQQLLVDTEQSLDHYTALGPEFMAVAQQYHLLKADADNKRWAIAELSKSQVTSDTQ